MKLRYLILILSLVIISCKKSDIKIGEAKQVNVTLKEKILAYLDNKIAKAGDSSKTVIENLKNKIVWSNYETAVTARKETQTVFKIENINNTQSRISEAYYTALYVVQNSIGGIRSIGTVEIVVPNGNQQNPNQLTLNLINNEIENYSGQLIKRNISGYLIYQVDISNGQVSSFKNLKKGNQSNQGQQRVTECIDWYLATYVNGVLVSEVYLFTDCGGNVQEGGGGNGGGNNQSSSTPCEHALALAQDSIFQAGAQFLREVTTLNYEIGLIKGKDVNGKPVFVQIQGTPGNPYVEPPIINVHIDGIMHSHFSGGSSIFSPADLRALYQIYADSMANPGFIFTVVTGNTAYSLYVDNVSDFLTYGQQHFVDEIAFDDFQVYKWFEYNIWEMGDAASTQAGFVRLLAGEGTGLKLLSSNTLNFNEWEVKGVGLNNDIIVIPC
jgi:hypothetical protein